MALNRDKYRSIVSGITTPKDAEGPPPETVPPAAPAPTAKPQPVGQGRAAAAANGADGQADSEGRRRFAQRGRPKARPGGEPAAKGPKVKVSLFLSEDLVNDFYDWAHDDRIQPGEMFERALRPFHEKEAKRRNAGKE